MIVKHNFNTMNFSPFIDEGSMDSTNVRIRINTEFLDSCKFNCAGCYVKRKNEFTDSDVDVLVNAIQMFRDSGASFDEVILGPTDFFSASNTEEVLSHEGFKSIFKDGDVVLTVLTTLQEGEERIKELIQCVNDNLTHPNMEMEVLIPFDIKRVVDKDPFYVMEMKRKIQILNLLNPTVDYAMQINIHDVDKMIPGFSLPEVTRYVRDTFGTIVEFNPSFMRVKKPHIITKVLDDWNDMLERHMDQLQAEDITFTMVNKYHASYNELTYNFKDGYLYVCPFIYENVVDLSEAFKIERQGEYYVIDDINAKDVSVIGDQYEYSSEVECATCEFQGSCVGKKVLYYMKQYDIAKCVVSKPVMAYYGTS